mgnify:CR=1 FL=1
MTKLSLVGSVSCERCRTSNSSTPRTSTKFDVELATATVTLEAVYSMAGGTMMLLGLQTRQRCF